jgi:translation initiation factor IF-3
MDYGKFRYEQSKQSKNKGTKANEIKEIRLGRSIKIDPHDVSIRVDQARRFLMAGHKVQFQQRYRGREMAFRGLGDEKLYQVVRDLADVSKVERAPITQGKQVTLVLAPDKVKIEAIKRKLAAEGKKQEEEDLEALEAQVAAQNLADSADDEPDDDAPDEDTKKDKKAKGKKDNRIKDPVNDEVSDLLGG